jgi:sterol desaturase/sphingolipid hydroxylase (fatty acid hydroxylase superfamily)
MIIFLQTYCFFIKMSDADTFNINPALVLQPSIRTNFQSLHFLAVNFRDFCIMEAAGLIFILFKVVDGLRVFSRLNKVVMAIVNSSQMIMIFTAIMILFNVALTPLAQAIWGNYFVGYKTFKDAVNSVFMISFAKGNLEFLLDINVIWSLIFMCMYYSVIVFLLHAAFHMIQTDSLKNIVLLNGLPEMDVVPKKSK